VYPNMCFIHRLTQVDKILAGTRWVIDDCLCWTLQLQRSEIVNICEVMKHLKHMGIQKDCFEKEFTEIP